MMRQVLAFLRSLPTSLVTRRESIMNGKSRLQQDPWQTLWSLTLILTWEPPRDLAVGWISE